MPENALMALVARVDTRERIGYFAGLKRAVPNPCSVPCKRAMPSVERRLANAVWRLRSPPREGAAASPDCFLPSGSVGVLSVSTGKYLPAYTAQAGRNFASGLGSVNVTNLVDAWYTVAP
jgi:hypothetical protein